MFKNENKTKQTQDVETVIGPSVKVEGDFEGTGDMIVDGIVVGNLKTKNFLQVGKEAKIKANVEAQNAYISGEVTGNLTIKEGVVLTATAKVTGDISCYSLAIEKGALINGKLLMTAQPTEIQKAVKN